MNKNATYSHVHQQIELLAWYSDDLTPFKFPNELVTKLQTLPPKQSIGEFKSMSMVARSKYLMLKF